MADALFLRPNRQQQRALHISLHRYQLFALLIQKGQGTVGPQTQRGGLPRGDLPAAAPAGDVEHGAVPKGVQGPVAPGQQGPGPGQDKEQPHKRQEQGKGEVQHRVQKAPQGRNHKGEAQGQQAQSQHQGDPALPHSQLGLGKLRQLRPVAQQQGQAQYQHRYKEQKRQGHTQPSGLCPSSQDPPQGQQAIGQRQDPIDPRGPFACGLGEGEPLQGVLFLALRFQSGGVLQGMSAVGALGGVNWFGGEVFLRDGQAFPALGAHP